MNKRSGLFLLVALAVGSLILAPLCWSGSAAIPAGETGAKAALEKSPRHHEWVKIAVPGSEAKLSSFVAFPERKNKAPVVIVIHEIYGLTDWIRGVADQLAGDGFVAIAPDLLSSRGPGARGTEGERRRTGSGQSANGRRTGSGHGN